MGEGLTGVPDVNKVAPVWLALISGGRASFLHTDSSAGSTGREVESIEINANLQDKHCSELAALWMCHDPPPKRE